MIDFQKVHSTIGRYQLADGMPVVQDLERSHGAWFFDGVTGSEFLDCYTGFASWPVGYNHPMMEEPGFVEAIGKAARNNPANSDVYTPQMAEFVEAFGSRVTPAEYTHHFWVAGGALAVENTLKTAFDWKARKLGRTSMEDSVNDLSILHFRQAFHGRSGYTMSLTNTVPDKVGLFPKFCWPRVLNPYVEFDHDGNLVGDYEEREAKSIAEIEKAFADNENKIAAIILEPIQGEGGDNHFRPEFLAQLRRIADEKEALLIFDEVQTGFYGTGKAWYWQHTGVQPDLVAFGKKTQVCGFYANSRVEEVADNVFARSSRINSTWGGNLVDMVRCRRFIDIIEEEKLAENITARGEQLVAGLRQISKEKGTFSNARGIGSWAAFTLETPEQRDGMIKSLFDQKLLSLASGTRSVRFRMPLVINAEEIDQILERVASAVPATV